MCLTGSHVVRWSGWNWGGDRIVHRCIVPSSRSVAAGSRRVDYDVDVREFLVTERNEIMRRVLREKLPAFVERLPGASLERFWSRDPGSFDHRIDVLAAFVGSHVAYEKGPGEDPWLFPDETIALGVGDCEDRALLLASLALAAGVSGYNLRVVVGKVRSTIAEPGKPASIQERDHVWVVYKTEPGSWTVVEPFNPMGEIEAKKDKPAEPPPHTSIEYIPYFVFNDSHLWAIEHPLVPTVDFADHLALRKQWTKFSPKFLGEVHRDIITQALAHLRGSPDAWVLDALNRYFKPAFAGIGPIVDAVDRDYGNYDPVDHFDNGYIDEGWRVVGQRLARFNESKDLDAFARAAHGIADFYAHSSYAHFAGRDAALHLYEPDRLDEIFTEEPNYSTGSFAFERFSGNAALWSKDRGDRSAPWNGKIISGRYAQNDDTQGGGVGWVIEGMTHIPAARRSEIDFFKRGALPHHNEIAVDGSAREDKHRLYRDVPGAEEEYARQYRRRFDAAVRHVRQVFDANWKKGGSARS
ncbi:MAG: hypothetical protein HYV09_19285 [Deltaproteobacteria bacterium]|nr:hypothetical protein [Deltaproteobacteria bacterium]